MVYVTKQGRSGGAMRVVGQAPRPPRSKEATQASQVVSGNSRNQTNPGRPASSRVSERLSLCSASDKTCRLPPHLRLHCRVPSRCTFFPAGVPEITSNFSALRSGARVGGTGRSSGGSDSGSIVSATLAAGPLSGNSIFELSRSEREPGEWDSIARLRLRRVDA